MVNRVDWIFLIGIGFIGVCILLSSWLLVSEYRKGQDFLNGFNEAYNIDLFTMQGGRWDSEGFYCVRTDSVFFDATDVDVHEQCHALIHEDDYHFCSTEGLS